MSLTHNCYEQIKSAIIEGQYRPGEPLKIHLLKEQYNMGGSPIREALSRLVSTGFVTNEGKTGFKVATMSDADKRDVHQTFYQIETLALTQAIASGDDHWEADILAALHALAKVENQEGNINHDIWQTRHYEFHFALIKACSSPTLLALREQVYWLMERYVRIDFLQGRRFNDRGPDHAEHAELAECVLHRQTVKACGLMKHHILGNLST